MTEYNNEEINGLEIGKKYTLINISECMAMTLRTEFILKGQEILPQYAQYTNILRLIITPKGKRTDFLVEITNSTAIFEGWDLPVKLDTEQTGSYTMRGNALINVLGTEQDTEKIRQIFNTNKNPTFKKGLVNLCEGDKETLVFKAEAEEIRHSHAVIDRMLNQNEE